MILVDWSTLVFYTCSNTSCAITQEGYIREYAWVQLSEDFARVQYGDEKEIRRQKQDKMVEQFRQEEEEVEKVRE